MYICIFVKQYHTSTGMLLVLYLSAKHIVQIIQSTGFLSTLRVGNIHWKQIFTWPYSKGVINNFFFFIFSMHFIRRKLEIFWHDKSDLYIFYIMILSAKHIVQIIQSTGFLSTLRVGNIHWHKMKGYYRHPYEYMVLHAM
jgi:mannose/fructose/N-acetylgalactosamine-specific phosphotransferase system component IIB